MQKLKLAKIFDFCAFEIFDFDAPNALRLRAPKIHRIFEGFLHSKTGGVRFLYVQAHVFITGRVQGVFFRGKTRNKAKKHQVNGWVRNLPDGRVEAVFEGKKENVDKLIDFASRGPSGAKVLDLNVKWQEYNGEFNDFEIHYF